MLGNSHPLIRAAYPDIYTQKIPADSAYDAFKSVMAGIPAAILDSYASYRKIHIIHNDNDHILPLYQGWEPREVLGTLGIFFLIRSLFTCLLQAKAGFYTPEVIRYAMYGIPACVAGALCAFPVVRRIRVDLFRRALMLVIAAAGLVCLWQAFS